MSFKKFIALNMFLIPNLVWACGCIEPPPLREQFEEHDHVFLVTIVSVEYQLPNVGDYGVQRAKYEVKEVFKGSSDGFEQITADVNFPRYGFDSQRYSSCDSSGVFAGASYIVFANFQEELEWNTCSSTVQMWRPDLYMGHDIETLQSWSLD